MADLTFADSHNMVAYLEKLEANANFAEKVNFLNASPIIYALTVEEKKFIAAKRAEEQRNKPPTKAEQRKKMYAYIKHMAGYKDKNFKGKSFDVIKQMFDKAYKHVNDFVPIDTKSSGKKVDSNGKKAENSKKQARAVLGEESVKRQKVEDDAEKAELKACLEIVPGDDSAVNIESLATKYPIIYLFQEKIESVSAQVVAAAKLPVLNPNEFELWKIRIEQYFLMADYALWEVILNGDSPLPTRTVDGVETVCIQASKAANGKEKWSHHEVWGGEKLGTRRCHQMTYDWGGAVSNSLQQEKKHLGLDQLTEDPFSSGQKDLVFVKSSTDDTKVTILGVERPWLSKVEGFILLNHNNGRILPAESQRNTTDPSVAFTDSSTTDYDSVDESSVCSTPLPLLKKLEGVEPISRPKTIKSILKSKSTLKAEALKCVIINEPSLAPAKGNKSSSALKVHSAPAGKLKSVKIKDDPSLAIVIKELNTKKAEALKSSRAESSNANRSKTPTKRESILGQLQTTTSSSINKCLLLLHWTLFDPVILRSINHEKYTLVIVDEYSRYTWVYFLMKKSQAPETIMSFIKRVENKNDIKVKQLRIDNGTEFRNSILVNFWDEKWISQNFSSPYTPEQLELWRGHLEPL
ncbi:retrovirus-related pol polyprotein from transposon TNT 1-94 [Tanacetum coccineum]